MVGDSAVNDLLDLEQKRTETGTEVNTFTITQVKITVLPPTVCSKEMHFIVLLTLFPDYNLK